MGLFKRRTLVASGLALPWTAWAQVLPLRPRALRFPRDHGSHNEARTEWWYLTGHARDERGQTFGFQLTFFRSRVDAAQALPGRLAARQLLMAHAAITDVSAGRLHHEQRIARWNGDAPTGGTAQPAWASSEDLHVSLRDGALRRQADGRYEARFDSESLGLDLLAAPRQAILLQGDAGWSRKGPLPENASHYVSHPQLSVQGELRLSGRRHQVNGTAWLDHEWSESLLHPDAVGWDWIGMNLDDGHSLTAFRLRRADGSTLWAGGSFRSASSADSPTDIHRFHPGEVEWVPRRHWTSPSTGARYPVEWGLRTPADIYTVRALIDPQEIDGRQSTGTVYWEGLADLFSSNGTHAGRGYLEMTGYAKKLSL